MFILSDSAAHPLQEVCHLYSAAESMGVEVRVMNEHMTCWTLLMLIMEFYTAILYHSYTVEILWYYLGVAESSNINILFGERLANAITSLHNLQ